MPWDLEFRVYGLAFTLKNVIKWLVFNVYHPKEQSKWWSPYHVYELCFWRGIALQEYSIQTKPSQIVRGKGICKLFVDSINAREDDLYSNDETFLP